MSKAYQGWADGFKGLKDFRQPSETAINKVIAYYSQPLRKVIKPTRGLVSCVGLPQKSNDRGEQKIERPLLERSPLKLFAKKAGLCLWR